QPIANRRRRLSLALRLSVYWSISILVGLAFIGAYRLWGFKSPAANWALCIGIVVTTFMAIYSYRKNRPDYKAIARNIEQHHSDAKALLLAAIEQEPQGPDGQFGYLQQRVIGEALRHAAGADWLQSVPTKKLIVSYISGIAALSILTVIMAQLLPSTPYLFKIKRGSSTIGYDYQISVSPGDTSIESGTPVVIIARFGRRVPQEAKLLFDLEGQPTQEIALARNLNDPVFGGIIQNVNRDLLYHIEYAGRRTRDYKITVYDYPALTRADAKIVYPSYTKLPERVVLNTRQISAIEGSRIDMTFILNKAVTTAELIPKEGPILKLTVDGRQPNIYTTSITAEQNQRYELHLTDAAGRANKVPHRFVIDVHKNLPAQLKPLFPNRDIQVSPLEELSLEAEVTDDFGVTSYGLSYTFAGQQSKDIILSQTDAASEQKQQMRCTLALEDFGVQPNQLLTYYFWADDIGPDGNVRRTAGDIYFAEVRPFEQIFHESESYVDRGSRQQRERENQDGGQEGQRGEQLVRLQKQIITATWNIKQQTERTGGIEDQKEDIKVVHQSQDDARQQAASALKEADDLSAAGALNEAIKHMGTSLKHLSQAAESAQIEELTSALAAEQAAYQELLKLRQREYNVALARDTQANRSERSAEFERQLQQLELRQNQNRYETQRLAQSEQQENQRENVAIFNRLSDLARRQNEMTDRLRDVQAALRQGQTDEQRQQAGAELARLRDEQLEALRDVDELQQRMDSPESRRDMVDASQQLGDARSGIQQSAEQLQQGQVSNAITSATRAQRQLEQMQDEFRRGTSGQFTEQMRNMRQQAQQLDSRQREVSNLIRRQAESRQKTLTDSGENLKLAERIEQQRKSMEELLEQMKDVSEQAETTEPLLSRRLYDTLRRASTENVDKALEAVGELLRRNFLPQAQDIEQQASEAIAQLRKGVEDAAGSVLGDEAEALRIAQQQLDELLKQVNDEVARAAGAGQFRAGDPNTSTSRGTGMADRRQGGDGLVEAGGAADPNGGGGSQAALWDAIDPNGPLTGRNFRQWSDRLRDVQDLLTEQQLRDEAARVRDRVRSMRADLARHGKEPQWDLVQQLIVNPLSELRNRVNEELARLKSDKVMVPIDRDPVPDRFSDLVRRYYENLGGD
ncbi:MAG: hypothetical protein A2167_02835, partial [Planctomycetes bacterium RBG_13_46_10]